MVDRSSGLPEYRYFAGGGVVVRDDHVLVVRRPSRGQVRLPKGHVEPGEEVADAAVREVVEETGFRGLEIVGDLGTQVVEFDFRDRRWMRTERYFVMSCDEAQPTGVGEEQFEPVWVSWSDALASLTFEAEREWVRRARRMLDGG